MPDERQDVLIEHAEQLAEVSRAGRGRGGQTLPHLFERVRLEDRFVAQPVDPGDEHLDDCAPHLPHLFGTQRKRIGTHPLPLELHWRQSSAPECSRRAS